MEKIKNENGTKCSRECPYLKRHQGTGMGQDGLPTDIFECLLLFRVFKVIPTPKLLPGDECPFAVLREVLGMQAQEPTRIRKAEAPDYFEFRECHHCANWVLNGGSLKCFPPTDGTSCPSFAPLVRPAVRSASLPADELHCFREALREWGEEQMRLRNRDRSSELQNQAARLANQASTMRHLIHATNRLENVRSRLRSILDTPLVEARTCSGDAMTCNCTMCQVRRALSYIDGGPST